MEIKCNPMTIEEAINILDKEIENGEVGKVANIEFIVAKNVVIEALLNRISKEELKDIM